MKNSVHDFLKIRLLVCYLGEKENGNWWNTAFLNQTGQRFLAFNFPRTAISAGLHSVTEAARKLHDERIGVGRVHHLFRLPMNLEEEIHSLQLRQDCIDDLSKLIANRDAAFESLRGFAGKDSVQAEGPVKAGGIQDLSKGEGVRLLAVYYCRAFEQGIQTFPYYQD